MKRIDSANAVGTEPIPPPPAASPGFFGGGDGAGVEGTIVTPDWLNDVQEEIVGVIEGAGLTPTKGVRQLLTALRALLTPTGTVIGGFWTAAAPGWCMMNDGTIGNAASGATRANADTAALFTLLWNNISSPSGNTICVVSGGLGASAAAAYAANKTLALPKALGRAMAAAGAGAGLTARTLGSVLGEEVHVSLENEMPSHVHTGDATQHAAGAGGPDVPHRFGGNGAWTSYPAGGDDSHNNMQPTFFVNFMIKL